MKYTNNDIASGLFVKSQTAFKMVYSQYRRQLYQYVNTFLKDPMASEDVVAEAYMKLWQMKAEFPHNKAVKSWLYITCYHQVMDIIRSSKMYNDHKDRIGYEHGSIDMQIFENEQEHHLREVIFKKLQKSIDQLPPQSGKIFRLMYYEGKSITEIAQELSLSKQTVKNTLGSCIKKLRSSLGPGDLVYLVLLLSLD